MNSVSDFSCQQISIINNLMHLVVVRKVKVILRHTPPAKYAPKSKTWYSVLAGTQKFLTFGEKSSVCL